MEDQSAIGHFLSIWISDFIGSVFGECAFTCKLLYLLRWSYFTLQAKIIKKRSNLNCKLFYLLSKKLARVAAYKVWIKLTTYFFPMEKHLNGSLALSLSLSLSLTFLPHLLFFEIYLDFDWQATCHLNPSR